MGGCFALIGVAAGVHSVSFSIGTSEVQGTVVRIDRGSPIVRYDVDGRPYEYRPTSGPPPSYKVGDKVTVLHRVRDPSRAQVDTFADRWSFPTAFSFSGICLMLLGYFGAKHHQQLSRRIRTLLF